MTITDVPSAKSPLSYCRLDGTSLFVNPGDAEFPSMEEGQGTLGPKKKSSLSLQYDEGDREILLDLRKVFRSVVQM